jgi:hypothetical protein
MPKSIIKYTTERQELLQKMFNILGITDDNKMFSLKKLDEDEDKQTQILALVDDIKKYFICARWTFFSQKNKELKRSYLSLIKAVFRDMEVKMYSTFIHKKIDDVIKCETIYILELNKNT